MRRRILVIQFCLVSIVMFELLFGSKVFAQNMKADSTQILIVGTIHDNHATCESYSYYDIVRILATYEPDAICVEIPPSLFRKEKYLKEMVLATIYGTANAINVYPIDWWGDGNDRAERNRYMETEDYEIKKREYSDLLNSSTIMQDFQSKYGSLEVIWSSNEKGFEFFNGDEYNDYVRQMYAINIQVFGDGPMNLHYITRNKNMLSLIDDVITENIGGKIIVLTGAEHKHFFDDELSKRSDLKLVRFDEILPLKSYAPDQVIADYIERNLARGYYDGSGRADDIDVRYHDALVPLVHGPDMDRYPSVIPAKNVDKAEGFIAEWRKENPRSAALGFEVGWIYFLKGDYKGAIQVLRNISNRLDEVPESMQWFVKPFYYRNLGLCYDMLGKRKMAIRYYNAGVETGKQLGLSDNIIMHIKAHMEVPYDGKVEKKELIRSGQK